MFVNMGGTIPEAVSRWLPTAAVRVRVRVWKVGFVVDNVASGRFSPSTSVTPAKIIHSTNFSILTITWSRHSEALRRADHPSKESC
jgi:hypothetical protein